jgi:hypothetical protein
MFTLATKSFKNPGSTVFRSCLAHQGPDKKDSMQPRYKILDEKFANKLQDQYKKMITEKKNQWSDIKNCNILDQDFKKDFKITLKKFVMCNPRNCAAMVFFSSVIAETVWVWNDPIISCASGVALFCLYSAQKLSFITTHEPINKVSIQLADISQTANLFAGMGYIFLVGNRFIEYPSTNFEIAIHLLLVWNFYKNIVEASKILPSDD